MERVIPEPTVEILKLFLSKVEPADKNGCWLWAGGLFKGSYGHFYIDRQTYLAHRVAWRYFRGDQPHGLFVCHHCDNPRCVNPEHLFLGTPRDNSQDMVAKGRACVGTRKPQHRLTEDIVTVARQAYRGGAEGTALARRYGVSLWVMYRALAGRTWRHVPNPCQIRPQGPSPRKRT